MGLWATEKFKKGAKVAPYTGKTVVSHDPKFGGNYVLQVKKNPPTFVDAAVTTSGAGRFSNNAKKGEGKNNAGLSAWFKAGEAHASLKAKQTIQPNKEIMTSYGRNYWK